MEATFFATPADFRAWFIEQQQQSAETAAKEIWVGFYKKNSGKSSINWSQAVDQALCFGWIDSVKRSLDDSSYAIRFTPRRPNSVWSTVNINKVAELTKLGLMQPAGLKAFNERKAEKSSVYSFEQPKETLRLDPAQEQLFQANSKAWEFFQSQAPWYQRAAIWWVISAKRAETKESRLATLIQDSEAGQTIASLTRTKSK